MDMPTPTTPRDPIWSSALKQIEADLSKLPADAKAAVVLTGESEHGEASIAIGTAARFGDGWVLSAEAEWKLRAKPRAKVGVGKVWK
jgi:hypothetical protein